MVAGVGREGLGLACYSVSGEECTAGWVQTGIWAPNSSHASYAAGLTLLLLLAVPLAVEGWTNEAVEADMAYLLLVVNR